MNQSVTRPPIDSALENAHSALAAGLPASMTEDMIPVMRAGNGAANTAQMVAEFGLSYREHSIPGYHGATITVTSIARPDHAGSGAGMLHLHAGGMVAGDRMTGVPPLLPWIVEHDAVLVTVEYRLAPEFPDPYPVEDAYAALVWMAEHAGEIGVDANRILLVGASGGAGVAAGMALLARDRRGPELTGQLLIAPMIDDRDQTVSTVQYDGMPPWDRATNRMGWTALLGDRRGTEDVSAYAAPARATDLTGLPPTYIDCGSAETFRDEDVAYASALWAAGVPTELHVWSGGFHGFDFVAPDAPVARAARQARASWVARHLSEQRQR